MPRKPKSFTSEAPLAPIPAEILDQAGLITNSSTSLPIAGVFVDVFQNSLLIGSTITGVNGSYTLPSLASGNYVVLAHKTNFQTSTQAAIVPFNQTLPLDYSLTADPGILTGQVIDASNNTPLSGVTVDVLNGLIIVGTGVTDSNGAYTILSLAPGNYTARASASNFQTSLQGVIVFANQTSIANFALPPLPGILVGQVTDAFSLAPIVGATVNVFQGAVLIASTISDSNGNYIINTLPQENYTVIGGATNFQTVVVGAIIFSNQTATLNLSLISSPGTISGEVINANTSLPIVGATVNVTQGIILIASTQTDSLGNYIVPNLAPGTYVVTASANLFSTSTHGAIVQSNITTIDNFALQENPGQIIGHVINANTNTSLTGVSINLLQGTQLIASTLTDSVGNYILPNLAPGNYTINANLLGFEIVTQGAIVQSNQTTINNFSLHSQPGTIIGNVINADTNAPIPVQL